MVGSFKQERNYGADLACGVRARISQTKGPYQPQQVPAKPGARSHSRVKELPARPVREQQDQDDNMLPQQHNLQRYKMKLSVLHLFYNNININNNFNVNNITDLITRFFRNTP